MAINTEGYIQFGQEPECYGENSHPINMLRGVQRKHDGLKQTIDNIEAAIKQLNYIGVDIDISVRGKHDIFIL